jgi:uncharacterized DUF497 family protein
LGGVTFEWDARKADANFKKHRVTFEDAVAVFLDPLAMTYMDPDHTLRERREITIRLYDESASGVRFPLRTWQTDSDH